MGTFGGLLILGRRVSLISVLDLSMKGLVKYFCSAPYSGCALNISKLDNSFPVGNIEMPWEEPLSSLLKLPFSPNHAMVGLSPPKIFRVLKQSNNHHLAMFLIQISPFVFEE